MKSGLRATVSLAYGPWSALRKAALAIVFATPTLAEPVTVAALGDSLTQGFGLAQEQGLVPQLQRWLDEAGAEAVLINAGVSGDTTAGGLARIDWTLSDNVDALIVALGGNDLLRGIEPAVSRANLDGILARAGAVPVLLVGMKAPGNFGPEYQAAFDAIYPELAETYGALHHDDLLGPISERLRAGAVLGSLMQSDAIHPNPDGVALIVEALGPKVLDLIARVE